MIKKEEFEIIVVSDKVVGKKLNKSKTKIYKFTINILIIFLCSVYFYNRIN